jgi:hypothetical protein
MTSDTNKHDKHVTKSNKTEKVFKKINEFIINVSHGEITIKKKNHEIYLIETKETELV